MSPSPNPEADIQHQAATRSAFAATRRPVKRPVVGKLRRSWGAQAAKGTCLVLALVIDLVRLPRARLSAASQLIGHQHLGANDEPMKPRQQAVRAGGLAVAAIRHLLAIALVALYVMLVGCVTIVGVAWAKAIYAAASQNQIQYALLTFVSLPLIAFAAILALPLTLVGGIQMEGVAVLAFAVLYVALFRTVATQRPYVALLGAACALTGYLIDTQAALHGKLQAAHTGTEPVWAYAGLAIAAAIAATSVSRTFVGVILNPSDEHN